MDPFLPAQSALTDDGVLMGSEIIPNKFAKIRSALFNLSIKAADTTLTFVPAGCVPDKL